MTVVFSHDWTGTNGAAWDSTVWTLVPTGTPTVDIQSVTGGDGGRGRVTYAATSDRFIAHPTTALNEDRTEILCRFRVTVTGFHQAFFARASGTFSSDDVTNGYRLLINPGTDTVSLRRYDNDAATDIVSDPSGVLLETNTDYWIRWQLDGSTIQWRVWQDGTSEPGTWDHSLTDATHASGTIAIGTVGGSSAGSAYFDDLTVDNMETATGAVLDGVATATAATVATDIKLLQAQYPTSTVSNTGTWLRSDTGTGTDLHLVLDDANNADLDYVESPENPSGSSFRLSLGSSTKPHRIRVRHAKNNTNQTITQSVTLYDDGVAVNTWTLPASTTTDTEATITLTQAEYDGIVSGSVLELAISATAT